MHDCISKGIDLCFYKKIITFAFSNSCQSISQEVGVVSEREHYILECVADALFFVLDCEQAEARYPAFLFVVKEYLYNQSDSGCLADIHISSYGNLLCHQVIKEDQPLENIIL